MIESNRVIKEHDYEPQMSSPTWPTDPKSGALMKEFEFKSFTEAFSFMTRVAFEAERMNHHPNWSNSYNRVTIRLLSHDAGDTVTDRDRELARRIDAIDWS